MDGHLGEFPATTDLDGDPTLAKAPKAWRKKLIMDRLTGLKGKTTVNRQFCVDALASGED